MTTRRWMTARVLAVAAMLVAGFTAVAITSDNPVPAASVTPEPIVAQPASDTCVSATTVNGVSTETAGDYGRVDCPCTHVHDCWVSCCAGAVNARCTQYGQCMCQWQ